MKRRKIPYAKRLERLERKCNRILSELLIIRERLSPRPDMDDAIDRLHRTASEMRARFESERDIARKLYGRHTSDR
ncbi:MAG: hypothetical protein HDS83_03270 [Bacteroidales bacterium]|nr:hypothetical protein [Bacteroidales bacterium]